MQEDAALPNFSLEDAVFPAAAARFPTPFYLYDQAGIERATQQLFSAFAWNPGYRQYYAIKALPNPHILKLLLDAGCGLDCSSATELLMAQRLGLSGPTIMFSANAMPPSELAQARSLDATINLDDISDIPSLAAQGGVPGVVSLRVNPGPVSPGLNRYMGEAISAKFGLMPSQLEDALLQLKAHGARGFGLHAMTASNMLDPGYYARNAAYLFDLGLQLEHTTGLQLQFINLSGGLGIPYRPNETPLDIALVGQQVQAAYRKAFGSRKDVAIFTELGRWLTGPHGFLLSRVIHKKEIWQTFIGLDASASNLMRPMLYGAYHHISVIGKQDAPHDQVVDVTGPLCENNDKFALARSLPRMDIGDLVLLHDAGAHGHAMGYQYNGRLRCAEVLYTTEGQFRLIRRAETPEDAFATLEGW